MRMYTTMHIKTYWLSHRDRILQDIMTIDLPLLCVPFRETLLKTLQRINTHSLQPTTHFVLLWRSTLKMKNSKAVHCSKAVSTATMQNAESMQWLP